MQNTVNKPFSCNITPRTHLNPEISGLVNRVLKGALLNKDSDYEYRIVACTKTFCLICVCAQNSILYPPLSTNRNTYVNAQKWDKLFKYKYFWTLNNSEKRDVKQHKVMVPGGHCHYGGDVPRHIYDRNIVNVTLKCSGWNMWQSIYDWNYLSRVVVRKPAKVPRLVGVLHFEMSCLTLQSRATGDKKKKFIFVFELPS